MSGGFIRHMPCPHCGSSDAGAEYDNGWAHCFSCGKNWPMKDHEPATTKQPSTSGGLAPRGAYISLEKRKLHADTLSRWSYSVDTEKSRHIADYKDANGRVVAQKIRLPNKEFTITGDLKAALPLYGQWLWPATGKRIIVVEGELDALSVSQVLNHKWPVVSVPNGAQGAAKAFRKAIEFLTGYDEVVLMFDNDEPGREASAECAGILPPGKAKIATLPLKDASDMLMAGRSEDLVRAVWDARPWRPDGVVVATDMIAQAATPRQLGRPWPWPELTALTGGRREAEVVVIGGPTGGGKSTFVTAIVASALQAGETVGGLFLEQPISETLQRVAGMIHGELLHEHSETVTEEYLLERLAVLRDLPPLLLYDHYGSTDWGVIQARIRYMAQAGGATTIVLDNLTALAATADDERKALEGIMAQIAGLAQELRVTLIIVSHLATPDGTPHEEGGRVTIRHLKGSRAIGFWAHTIIGLERDQQADAEEDRRKVTVRILKDRFSGRATGSTIDLIYEPTTGRLQELLFEPEPDVAF